MRKPITAALATLALALGLTLTGAPQAQASSAWSAWIDCRYSYGTGINAYTPISVQVTTSANGLGAVVTAVKFGNGNSEPIRKLDFYNTTGFTTQVGSHPSWEWSPTVTSWPGTFISNPYIAAGNRWVHVKITRDEPGVIPDNSCYRDITY
jgi:hypothetical protein